MKKRGQITIFIFLGIAFLTIVGSLIYISDRQMPIEDEILKPSKIEFTSQSFEESLKICFEENLKEVLYIFGLEGGATIFSVTSLVTAELPIQNLYLHGQNLIQPISEWEDHIGAALAERTHRCKEAVPLSPDIDVQWPEQALVSATLAEETTLAKIAYPVHVKGEGWEKDINEFIVRVPVRLGYIHQRAERLINDMAKNPDALPYHTLSGLGLETAVEKKSDSFFIFVLTDPLSKIDEHTYSFMFGALYGDEKKVITDPPRILNGFETLRAEIGKQFKYRVKVHDPNLDILSFSDNTKLFDIQDDGTIQFVPKDDDMGLHEVAIDVTDGIEIAQTRLLIMVVP